MSPRESAMLEFLGTFSTLQGPPPDALSDLSDGVILFDALSEMYVMFSFVVSCACMYFHIQAPWLVLEFSAWHTKKERTYCE